ncbi:MAG: type IX secretion system outer membrane channel protein PorV [Paludibacter sp.]|nr:type IX secretion system outer membrane channel protein PorV [Bacteroidales bacterium]MCM1068846.1 type IX secretion system outer membrane channel protein PorV [Prevotella sp.]MCM1353107.1 type IX secretion system outer membrane channel protein PorV [Bacteroides sp.]MCM1442429.1 type IX secretion system outer membrane channel protein PorV [Muribaculum sp.]MCM1481272.1 type IX secretion system outer membrane channel protein PorV [Paludibacter sp.]
MKKVVFGFCAVALLAVSTARAEETMNPIITAMPSLSIAPDAHAGGLGDVGAATTPDMNSQHWNAAKYAFMDSHGGITANYTPWLRKLVKDIDLAYLAGFYKFDDLQAISASFTYFSLGNVALTDIKGTFLQDAHPNEWALDVAYSRKLIEHLSMAVTLRFMYSDMNNGANASTMGGVSKEMYPGWTMAADVSLYYRLPIQIAMGESYFALGVNISNLGGKISYDKKETQNFIPANLRIGVSYELPFDDYNRLSFNADINKYMVPTRNSKYAVDAEGNGLTGQALTDWYSDLSSARGWWLSFADAPGGFKEEMQEIQFGVGLEYSYNRQFFARVGYSHENKWKGNRRYCTVGAGFKLSIFSLDAAYVIATNATNPLDQTLRFTLAFDLAGIKDLVKK